VQERILYELFHIKESIEHNAREIQTQNKDLAALREDQRMRLSARGCQKGAGPGSLDCDAKREENREGREGIGCE